VRQLRWWLVDLWESAGGGTDAKVIVGLIAVLLLGMGGYLAAHEVSNAGASTGPATLSRGHLVRLTTTVRDPITVRLHGHDVVRWRTRRQVITAQAQTVMQTQTIRTPGGTRVVSRPVIRYRIAYRKKVVTVDGKAHTIVRPVTSTLQQTVNQTVSQTVVRTVVQPVTVVQTETVVSTETLPGTTVTLPGTTLTVTLPSTT
jgi:hypothetical protein